jgi:hypothetical protein
MAKANKPGTRRRRGTPPRAARATKTRALERRAAAERSAPPTADGDAALAPDDNTALAPDDRVFASNRTLHELFAQQTARLFERADLSEEQKQSLLIGMSCPCCGAGGFSFTAKLKR